MFPFVGFVKFHVVWCLAAPLPETKRRNKNLKKNRVLEDTFSFAVCGIYSFLAKDKLQMSLEVHFAQKQRRKETKIKGQSEVGRGLLRWEFY